MFKIIMITALTIFSYAAIAEQSPTNIDQALYFKSSVADANHCKTALKVKNGKIHFENVSNPALTCPDAFAWKQFLEAVNLQFWSQWSTDQQIWVEKPKAFCSNSSESDCCVLDKKNGKVEYRGSSPQGDSHCPFYPEASGGIELTHFSDSQKLSFHAKNQALALDEDISRVARDTEAEIVYHNKAFFNYTVTNNLYHTHGLKEVFNKKQFEAQNQAPHRPLQQGISYPEDAIMFKVDFIAEKIMKRLGYINDHDSDPETPMNSAEHPYITMEIKDPKTNQSARHYLVAITGASKALPNWHWYAFEHVNNIGRCDYLGCNDSYGFSHMVNVNMPNDTQKSIQSHYISPHQVTTKLGDNLFIRNKKYSSADMTPQLEKLFNKMRIGQKTVSSAKKMPSVKDSAWKSYRLKGTQVNYYHNSGAPVTLGASVTEGGFVNTSSCMSCHVQASVNHQGSASSGPIGSTINLSLEGINKVTNGAPEFSVFYAPGSSQVNAARIDFVWGILNAQPLSEE